MTKYANNIYSVHVNVCLHISWQKQQLQKCRKSFGGKIDHHPEIYRACDAENVGPNYNSWP